MIIDLTKLISSEVDEISVCESIEIPKELLEGTEIKDISKIDVDGNITENGESYDLNLHIKCNLTLICSVSLKDVNYPIDIDINEIISQTGENLEDFYKIINNSIDLVPIIWQNILVEVPIRVVSPDIEEKNIYGDGWKFITTEEEKKEIDPRLEKLKDFLSE
ncbi:MAG: DUF177 domain-containing protein [Bacilli bacterium]|nr:DUF177 domain-containing protein [Bacilli bacterium]